MSGDLKGTALQSTANSIRYQLTAQGRAATVNKQVHNTKNYSTKHNSTKRQRVTLLIAAFCYGSLFSGLKSKPHHPPLPGSADCKAQDKLTAVTCLPYISRGDLKGCTALKTSSVISFCGINIISTAYSVTAAAVGWASENEAGAVFESVSSPPRRLSLTSRLI